MKAKVIDDAAHYTGRSDHLPPDTATAAAPRLTANIAAQASSKPAGWVLSFFTAKV